MPSKVTRSTNEDKIGWLIAHNDMWKMSPNVVAMLDTIANGFVEAGLVVSAKNVSDVSTLKLITKAAKRMREESHT